MHEYIAAANGCWQRSDSVENAILGLKRRLTGISKRTAIVYKVPPLTQISEVGSFVFFPPEGKTWDDIDSSVYCQTEEVQTVEVQPLREELTQYLLKFAKRYGTLDMLADALDEMELSQLEEFSRTYL